MMLTKVSIRTVFVVKMIFLILATGFFINYRGNLPRIVIVHSYDLEYNWVQQINQGMKKVFAEHPNIIIDYQYLNIRNHPSASYKQRAGMLVRRVIDNWKPMIVVTVDEDAQDYVGKFYADDPNTIVVFCAINADQKEYGYDKLKNNTGVIERIPIDALKNIIPYLLAADQKPESIKVIALGDLSKTVKFVKKYFDSYDWSPLNLIETILIDNFDDWKAAVTRANSHADCLLLSDVDEIKLHTGGTQYVPAGEIIKWTELNATIPVIGCDGEFVANGGNVAISPSGYEQGEIAARYVLKILNGDDIATLPILSTSQYLIYMRSSALTKFPRLPAIYEQFARGTGKFYP